MFDRAPRSAAPNKQASRRIVHGSRSLSSMFLGSAGRPGDEADTTTDTLAYYDGVQVFEGRDLVGGHYVGVWVETAAGADRYLAACVVPERLREFRAGAVDLRTLLLGARDGGWLLADVTDGFEAPVTLQPIDNPVECSRFLPDEGFFLHDRRGDDPVVPGVHGGG